MENTKPIGIEEEVETVDKNEKFREDSVALIRKAIIAIENVGKLSNMKKYAFSEEEVNTMFNALSESLEDTKHLFKQKKAFSWDE